MSTQYPSQYVSPPVQTHWPWEQVPDAEHRTAQEPQYLELVSRSTQSPPQLTVPPVHRHEPSSQTAGVPQAKPQRPQ